MVVQVGQFQVQDGGLLGIDGKGQRVVIQLDPQRVPRLTVGHLDVMLQGVGLGQPVDADEFNDGLKEGKTLRSFIPKDSTLLLDSSEAGQRC